MVIIHSEGHYREQRVSMAAWSSKQKPWPPLAGQEWLWWWSEGTNATSQKMTKCLLTNYNETFQNQVVSLSYMCLLLGARGRYCQQGQTCSCVCLLHRWQMCFQFTYSVCPLSVLRDEEFLKVRRTDGYWSSWKDQVPPFTYEVQNLKGLGICILASSICDFSAE